MPAAVKKERHAIELWPGGDKAISKSRKSIKHDGEATVGVVL